MKKYISSLLLCSLLFIGSARADIQKATLFHPDTCDRKVVEIGQPGIFDGGWELETSGNNCDTYSDSDLLQVGVATGDSDLPLTLASFETTLASKLTSSGTSMTLTSATDDDGNTLSGYYGFTIDAGSTLQEYVIANCTGTACSSMLRGVSVADGQTEVSALKQQHRRGASVKITNHPNLVIITEILNGNDGVPATLYYDSQPTFSDDEEIITKKYADDLAISGSPNASETAKGIVEIGTQTEVASSTSSGGTGADLVIPADIATSSPDVRGLYIPVAENDGYLDQDWLDLSEDFTISGDLAVATTTQFGVNGGLMPAGSITAYATTTPPTGWLACDGSSLATSTYSALFAVIGYSYGGSDASFNLPNLNGRNIIGYGSATTTIDTMGETGGEDEHVQSIDEMPAHTHSLPFYDSGASTPRDLITNNPSDNSSYGNPTGSTGGGSAFNVLDPYIVLRYIIKY